MKHGSSLGSPGGAVDHAIGAPSTRRHGAKNADYPGGVTCLYDTQLLVACLHASESGGRSRPEAVRGMPEVPITHPATGPPEGWAAVGLVSSSLVLRTGVVGAFAQGFGLFSSDLGSERVRIWVIDRFEAQEWFIQIGLSMATSLS